MEIVAVTADQGQDARIDTRALAEAMDNEHESLMRIVGKYESSFEALGILRFEIGEITGRGQPSRFATLNEGQCYFLLSLVRNTERTVPMKLALIEKVMAAFQLIRKHQETVQAQALASLGHHALTHEITQNAKQKAREDMASQVVTLGVVAHAYGLTRQAAEYSLQSYGIDPAGWFENCTAKRKDKTEYVYPMLAVFENFRGGLGPDAGKAFTAFDGDYTKPRPRFQLGA